MGSASGISRLLGLGAITAGEVPTKGYLDDLSAWASGMGKVRATRAPVPLAVDANYAAFPGAVWFPDTGQIRLVWRQGTDHYLARDGVIKTATSDDLGRTWSLATTTVADPAAPDLRDPSISTSPTLTTTYLTYFKGSAANSAAGSFFRLSGDRGITWGAEVRIDANMPYSAICAPVVTLASGALAAVFYGKANTGTETYDSCWFTTSANGGTTWTAPVRVCNGQAASTHYQEPWLIVNGTTLTVYYRHGSGNIGMIRSTNSGSSWTAPAVTIANATGRPSAVRMTSGTVALQYRRATDAAACLRTSRDGSTWYPEAVLFTGTTSLAMAYCAPIEIVPGLVYCPSAKEISASSAKLYSIYLTEGAGATPLGDSVPGGYESIADDIDFIAFADIFHYPNNSVPGPWYAGAGSIAVSEGKLVAAVQDNNPDYGLVAVGTPDVWIEADLMWSGAQAGFGVILRWVNSSNFLYYTTETGGTVMRLYKVVAGVTSVLAGPFTDGLAPDVWHRLTVSARGGRISCSANGVLSFAHTLTTPDYTTFGTSGIHGVKLNPAAGGQHYCRRFLVRS